jgi:glycosyltransferase involved in cell wall biosynthesis
METLLKIPTLSVVMSMYNQELYVKESIESVLAQTYRDFELIIIDDGSTDTSEQVVATFSDPRIRYITNNMNLGIVATSNRGLMLSRGKYIARLDSDDIAYPDRFQRQVEYLESTPDVGLVGSFFKTIETKPRVVRPPTTHAEIADSLLFGNCFGHSTIMFRRELFESHNLNYPNVGGGSEDYAFYLASIPFVNMANIPEVLLGYRVHLKQISHVQNNLQKSFASEVRLKYVESLLKRSLSEEEAVIHNRLCSTHVQDREELKASVVWLGQLRQAVARESRVLKNKLRKEFRKSVRKYGPNLLFIYMDAQGRSRFSWKELGFYAIATLSWLKHYFLPSPIK